MKRVVAAALVGVALVAVLGLVGGALAGESLSVAQSQYGSTGHAGGPAQDVVYGGGRYGGASTDGSPPFFVTLREFSIDAHASPNGAGAYGTFALGNPNNGNLSFGGDVTCLDIAGDTAVAGGYIRESVDPAAVGRAFFVYFKDLGRAGSGTLDRGSAFFSDLADSPDLPNGFPRECTPVGNNAFGFGYVPFVAGDIVIHDE